MTRQKNDGRPRFDDSHQIHGPYWMRAHRDWRFVTVVILMLGAMAVYLITSNLSWGPRGRTVPQAAILP